MRTTAQDEGDGRSHDGGSSGPGAVTLAVVPWDDDDVAALRSAQEAEVARLYDDDEPDPQPPAAEILATVLLRVDGEPAACGALRDATALGARWGELKRMYVAPVYRGNGLARQVLSELERIAVDRGLVRLVLETGVPQAAAVALYRSAGYRRIRNYGVWADDPRSLCFARWLDPVDRTHVLVVSGTVGAGKTTVAEAVTDLLRERGTAYGWVDVDALRRAYPTEPTDPYADDLALEHLTAMADVLRRRGYRHVVLSDAVERVEARDRLEIAFDGGDVTVVRLTASERVRLDRLRARGDSDFALDWHLRRTVELDALLARAGADDAVVVNEGRDAAETAAEVLAAAGW